MAEESILTTIKKMIGVDESYNAFDTDILVAINSAISTLNQLGVGPVDGLSVQDENTNWEQLLPPSPLLDMVKNYIYLKVRYQFDPPSTGYHTTAAQEQIREHEYRISIARESVAWVPPPSAVIVVEEPDF